MIKFWKIVLALAIYATLEGFGVNSMSWMHVPCKDNKDCKEKRQCCPIPGRAWEKRCYLNCAQLKNTTMNAKPECTKLTVGKKKFVHCKSPVLNWFQALNHCCLKEQGTLAFFDTEDELKATIKHLAFVPNFLGIWTGANDIIIDKRMQWLNRKDIPSIGFWAPTQPDLKVESCGLISNEVLPILMHDYSCRTRFPFLCSVK